MVRAYADRPVPAEALEAVLDAALHAPSAGFTQGVSLLVLTDPVDRRRYWELTIEGDRETAWLRGMRTAAALVLVWTSREAYLDRYAEPDKGWKDRDPDRWPTPYWFVDAGMAAMNALLTAADAGLGACFFGIPGGRVGAVRTAFAVPAEQLSVGVIGLGYPSPGGRPSGSPLRRPRRPAAELVHRGRWTVEPDRA
jgi:nitroreductase